MSRTNLPPPRTDKAEVLRALITRPEISEQDFRQQGFKMRIKELKDDGVAIRDKIVQDKNKHGHHRAYKIRYLWTISIPKAIRYYYKINA